MPNMRILALAVLKLSCLQGFMAESKRGITLPYKGNFAIQGPTEKKIRVRLLFILMLHIKFQVPSSSGSLVLQPTKGRTYRRTDRQAQNQYAPSNSSKLGA